MSSSGTAGLMKQKHNSGMGKPMDSHLSCHDVFSKIRQKNIPESFDSSVPEDLVYSGSKKLTDKIDGTPLDTGKLVLSPTRTYAP